MNTKEDLLKYMATHHACEEATRWVQAREGSFEEIVNECNEPDWLCWLLAYMRPRAVADFATRCADRIKASGTWSEHCRIHSFDSANRAHSLAQDDTAPVITASDAAYWAWSAAADRNAEHATQMSDLRKTILGL